MISAFQLLIGIVNCQFGEAVQTPICRPLTVRKTPPLPFRRGRGFDYVLRTNFSRHLGQVMEIFPFPRGTRTVWRHLGQTK